MAARSARCEALCRAVSVYSLGNAVNPAKAKRLLDRFKIRNIGDTVIGHKPDGFALSMMLLQPGAPGEKIAGMVNFGDVNNTPPKTIAY